MIALSKVFNNVYIMVTEKCAGECISSANGLTSKHRIYELYRSKWKPMNGTPQVVGKAGQSKRCTVL